MGVINKYTIWVIDKDKDLFTEIRNKTAQKIALNVFDSEKKDRFAKEEIDYITSAFSNEKELMKFLSGLSLFINPNSHIEITHQYNGTRIDRPIYDNKFIHKFSEEVIIAKRNGKKEKSYYLGNSNELQNFVKNLLANCDIEFMLACKKEIISPGLMYLFSQYLSLDKDKDYIQRFNIARQIMAFSSNYRTVRKLVCIQEELKRSKTVDKSEYNHLNANMIRDIIVSPIQDKRLKSLFEQGGLRAVFDNMEPIDIFACSANDLRKIEILPCSFTLWEYKDYQKAHPELKGPKKDSEEEPFVNIHTQPIDNALLSDLYERYSDSDGQVDYESLFNDVSIDDLFNNPNNYEDLVAFGLIPEGTKKEDVFYDNKGSKK